jgi:hypothetical protein
MWTCTTPCQLGSLESAKNYLKQAFKIDSSWRIIALHDKDLEPFWEKLVGMQPEARCTQTSFSQGGSDAKG